MDIRAIGNEVHIRLGPTEARHFAQFLRRVSSLFDETPDALERAAEEAEHNE